LEQKIQELLDDPTEAQRIATNSVNVFRERYLTAAADACYWRALLQAWRAASPDITLKSAPQTGLRYESFLLLEDSNMMHFAL
jgi:hypothetical protein